MASGGGATELYVMSLWGTEVVGFGNRIASFQAAAIP